MIKSSKTLATLLYKVMTFDTHYLKEVKPKTYFAVALITAGVLGFNTFNGKAKKKADVPIDYFGFFLLLCSLIIDAFVINKQSDISKTHKPSSLDMLMSCAVYAVGFSIIGIFVKGEHSASYEFFTENRELLVKFIQIGCCQAVGQFFIYGTMSEIGGLRLSMVTSSRKILTVMMSMVIFAHPLTWGQGLSVVMIILSLFMEFADKVFGSQNNLLDSKKVI